MRNCWRILFAGIWMVAVGSPAPAGEPLTWQDCLREAAKNHPDLIAAQEVIMQEQASWVGA